MPCPTYPSIKLAVLPGEKVRRRITELAPHALHIATEGSLGWAARNFAVELGIPFTTAYHTRFPEYVQARLMLPLRVTYGELSCFLLCCGVGNPIQFEKWQPLKPPSPPTHTPHTPQPT